MKTMVVVRPIISPLPKGRLGTLAEVLALLGLLLGIGLVIHFWRLLPPTIPVHFDASGRADGYGGRGGLVVLPVIGTLTYLILTGVTRIPHMFNYPWPITPGNAERQYRLAVGMFVWQKAVIMWLLGGLIYGICRVAQGRNWVFGRWFLAAAVGGMLGVLTIYLILGYRSR